MVLAFRPISATSSSNRSLRPNRPARGRALACRSAMTSSHSSTAVRLRSKARSGRIPSSRCACRARTRKNSRGKNNREASVSVSILIVDDEPDVAELFRQRFRRETRQGTYVLHFALLRRGGAAALDGEIEPRADRDPVRYQHAGDGRADALATRSRRSCPDLPVMMVTAYGDDERRRAGQRIRRRRVHHQAGGFRFVETPAPTQLPGPHGGWRSGQDPRRRRRGRFRAADPAAFPPRDPRPRNSPSALPVTARRRSRCSPRSPTSSSCSSTSTCR